MNHPFILTVLVIGAAAVRADSPPAEVPTPHRRQPATTQQRPILGLAPKPETRPLPPAPEGVTDLKFGDIFKSPVGEKGLEFSEKAKVLAGKKVRILGHMVQQSSPTPWKILLSPKAITVCEREYGLCDDLPPSVVHVLLPKGPNPVAQFTPGLLLLTGTLSIGNRDESDGRVSSVRLQLDPPPIKDHAVSVKHPAPVTSGRVNTDPDRTAPTVQSK